MQKYNYKILLISIVCFCCFNCISQGLHFKDSSYTKSFNLVPILAFDSDNGFRYGATINIFRIKKSDIKGDFRPFSDNFFIRGFNSTKGNFQGTLLLESNSLIPNKKTFIEISAARENSFDFYGLNGYLSGYDKRLVSEGQPEFIHKNYYRHSKSFIKGRIDIQHNLFSSYTRLLTGVSFVRNFTAQDSLSLLSEYAQQGLIDPIGSPTTSMQFTFGLIQEKRNNQFYCTKGHWHDFFFVYSQNKNSSYLKSIVTLRNYIPIISKRNIFMFRLTGQNTLAGKIPYDHSGYYFDSRLSTDGIGGINNLRGKPRNRMIAKGFILLNSEFKRTLFTKEIKKSEYTVDASLFGDHYLITQLYKFDNNSSPTNYDPNQSRYCATLGLGTYIVINKNSVISINYGYPVTKNEQGGRLYIGAGFMF